MFATYSTTNRTRTNNSPFSRHCLNMTYTQCFSLNKASQVFTQQRLQDGKDSMMMLPSTGNLAALASTTCCQIPSLKLTATATPPTKIDGWKEDDFFLGLLLGSVFSTIFDGILGIRKTWFKWNLFIGKIDSMTLNDVFTIPQYPVNYPEL